MNDILTPHILLSIMWLIYAALLAMLNCKSGKALPAAFHTAIICSSIWAATATIWAAT